MSIAEKINGLSPLSVDSRLSSFVSSDESERIHTTFYFDKKSGHSFARVLFGPLAQGPPGHAHGGAIAAVLDEAMGAAAWLNGYTVMTAKLEITYLKSLKLREEAFIESWVSRVNAKKVFVKGVLTAADDTLFAQSKGLFIVRSIERIQSMGEIPDHIFKKYFNRDN